MSGVREKIPVDSSIDFHVEAGGRALPDQLIEPSRQWIQALIRARQGSVAPINYIFCGDDYLHTLNVKHLGHDTLTDIITFPYEEFPVVSGDLFISTERVADNAADNMVGFEEELCRVMAHGILHLCGQGDKTTSETNEMRRLEEWALTIRPEALIR